jgi:four helix bundle protein
MATITRFEDLEIWKLAREQAIEIYKLTQSGSFARDFELKDQINASAGSSMDNIAEGFERFTNREFAQFLVISKGSNGEVRSQLYRAFDRNHISGETLKKRLEFSVMLGNKIKSFLDYLQSSKYKSKPRKKD